MPTPVHADWQTTRNAEWSLLLPICVAEWPIQVAFYYVTKLMQVQIWFSYFSFFFSFQLARRDKIPQKSATTTAPEKSPVAGKTPEKAKKKPATKAWLYVWLICSVTCRQVACLQGLHLTRERVVCQKFWCAWCTSRIEQTETTTVWLCIPYCSCTWCCVPQMLLLFN